MVYDPWPWGCNSDYSKRESRIDGKTYSPIDPISFIRSAILEGIFTNTHIFFPGTRQVENWGHFALRPLQRFVSLRICEIAIAFEIWGKQWNNAQKNTSHLFTLGNLLLAILPQRGLFFGGKDIHWEFRSLKCHRGVDFFRALNNESNGGQRVHLERYIISTKTKPQQRKRDISG